MPLKPFSVSFKCLIYLIYTSKQSENGKWIYENGLSYDMAYVTTVTGWLKLLETNFSNFKWFSCPLFHMYFVYIDRRVILNGLIKGIYAGSFSYQVEFASNSVKNLLRRKFFSISDNVFLEILKDSSHRNSDNSTSLQQ